MCVCIHTPSVTAGTYTPCPGSCQLLLSLGKPRPALKPLLRCLVPLGCQPHPRTCHHPPRGPPHTHTEVAHPEPSRAVVFVMAKAVGGLSALNGPDSWIGLTPPPPPPVVLMQLPEAPCDEMPQGGGEGGCIKCPRWNSARDACKRQLTEPWQETPETGSTSFIPFFQSLRLSWRPSGFPQGIQGT